MLLLWLFFTASGTPLDDYVNKPDAHYQWTDTGVVLKGYSNDSKQSWAGYVLNMTSQKWLSEREVSRPLWVHNLVVIVPSAVSDRSHGFLWITGGKTGDVPSAESREIQWAGNLAMNTGIVVGVLFQIPNQPITFPSDPLQMNRTEDDIIAFTWAHFMDNPTDSEWLLRMPMTKACVRALDTISAFRQRQGSSAVTKFFAGGASKRGWTTWTLGAVDKRMVGIVPVVMDELNFVRNLHHHYRAYGGWSFALDAYYNVGITSRLDEPVVQTMMDIVDPISYKDRYNYPKFVVNAADDEFFLPDDTRYWWDEMPEPKYFLMAPNSPHSTAPVISDLLLPTLSTWMGAVMQKRALPSVTWKIDPVNGDITLTIKDNNNDIQRQQQTPVVKMWQATTCDGRRRDFRMYNIDQPCVCGHVEGSRCINTNVVWTPTELPPTTTNANGNGTANATLTYVASSKGVPGKWTGFFIDVQFAPQGLQVTSEVSIVPTTFPVPDCHGAACKSRLL